MRYRSIPLLDNRIEMLLTFPDRAPEGTVGGVRGAGTEDQDHQDQPT